VLPLAPQGSAQAEYDQQQLRGECEVFDRTGGLTLIFTGRRSIPGIELGSQIRATGTIGETTGRLTITDPAYQILAGCRDGA
jgi:hypothetical protein